MEETKLEKLKMSEAAIEKMKELHPHIEEARISYERSNMDLPEKKKEIFIAGVKRINGAEVKEHAEVIKGLNQEERLQELVNMAFNEDPIKASQISLELKDPYVEDRLHDILVEHYDELRKSGKLKEV